MTGIDYRLIENTLSISEALQRMHQNPSHTAKVTLWTGSNVAVPVRLRISPVQGNKISVVVSYDGLKGRSAFHTCFHRETVQNIIHYVYRLMQKWGNPFPQY